MNVSRLPVPVVAVALGASLLVSQSCGSGDSSPSTPPPVVVPTPPPTTPPPGGGVAQSCRIGPGDVNADCDKKSSKLLVSIETAIDLLVREKPQIFDLEDQATPGSGAYKVLDSEAYLDGMVTNLVRQGLCAERDSDDPYFQRILVKNEQGFSETYDVLLSSGYVRRGGSAYLQTCTPASFPLQRGADTDVPPVGSGCGRPYPPPISRLSCKVHLKGIEYYTLDSTPQVGPDVSYCASIGFTDGRSICPVRPEGAPDRTACEAWRVGDAKDSGRSGPTWRNLDTGSYCTGPDTNCLVSPSNAYQLFVYRSGRFEVCAQTGSCCTVTVER